VTNSGRRRILIVDDDDTTRAVAHALVLSSGFEAETASNGVDALTKLGSRIDLVLLDIVMPGLDGFEVCRRMRRHPVGCDIPIIMLTSQSSREDRLRAVDAGANDFIAKPIEETEFRTRSSSLLRLKDAQDALRRHQAHLEELVQQRTASLRTALEELVEAQRRAQRAHLDTVAMLALVAEFKDRTTAQHLDRMSRYCGILARALGLPAEEVELIQHASRMHDLGKIAVPDNILSKPSSLDAPEWEIMRDHASIGAAILATADSELMQAGRIIAMSHHERWDGKGYPAKLAGEDIPLWGRICAVADTFDAVTSERSYKPALSNETALAVLREGRGTQFDPRIVDAFLACYDEILEVQRASRPA